MSRSPAALRSSEGRTHRLRRAPARALAALLLSLQATTGVVFPLVDAAGPHEAAVVAHWDGESDRQCPPQHSEGDCLVVKSLTASALPAATRLAVAGSVLRADVRRPVAETLPLAAADRRIPPATGPPAA